MNAARKVTVLDRDPGCTAPTGRRRSLRILRRVRVEVADRETGIFVLTLASELSQVGEFVRVANRRHQLRGLLVRADVHERWIGQLLDRAGIRTLRNLVVHRSPSLPWRIVNAWCTGSQDELVADAEVVAGRLLVLTCGLERLEVPPASVPALTHLNAEELRSFQIAADGSYLHWPEPDLHLDVEALRVAIDPAARARAGRQRLRHDQRFGAAVRALREASGLRQSDVVGLSARQLRRIEMGEFFPRVETLEKIASAHGLTLERFLDAVAVKLVPGC